MPERITDPVVLKMMTDEDLARHVRDLETNNMAKPLEVELAKRLSEYSKKADEMENLINKLEKFDHHGKKID